MRQTLLTLSLTGFIILASLFGLSFSTPIAIERVARKVVQIEIETRIGQRFEYLTNANIASLAQRAASQIDREVEFDLPAFRDQLLASTNRVMDNMLDANCECRQRLVKLVDRTYSLGVLSLQRDHESLTRMIESIYASVSNNLIREFRIFTGSNALALAILFLTTLCRRGASLQLLLPAIVIFGAMLATASVYLFNQNWLHTIIYGEYVGYSYLAYLATVTAFIGDIVFNKARATTVLFNAAANIAGSTLTTSPC